MAAEALIIWILVFAAVVYGATATWAIIFVSWSTLALAVVTWLRRLSLQNLRLPGPAPILAIALLATSVVVSTWFSIYRYGSIRDAVRIFDYIVFFCLVSLNLSDQRAVVRLLTAIAVVAALLPFAGAFQDGLSGGHARLFDDIWDSFKTGTFPNQDHFGAFLTLALFGGIGVAGYFATERRWGALAFIIPCLGVATVGLMETLTRAAWLGMVLGFLAILFVLGRARAIPRARKLQLTTAAATACILAVGLAPETVVQRMRTLLPLGDTADAMAFRHAVWRDSLRIIQAHPFVGTGPGTFHLVYPQYKSAEVHLPTLFVDYPHNDYLQYAAEMGLPGGAALLAIPLLLIYQVGRHAVRAPWNSGLPLALGILGSIAAFSTAAFYSFELSITANGLLFWGMLAAADRVLTLDVADTSRIPPPMFAGSRC